MFRPMVISILLVLPGVGVAAESQLLKLVRERAKITSGEITLRIRYLSDARDPNIVGANWAMHYWFQSDPTAFRLDLSKGHEQGTDATTLRYAFDGSSYKLIDDVDRRLPLREYVKLKPQAAPELFDPRLLGLQFDSFMAMHAFTLDDVRRIVTNAVSWDREEVGDGITETYNHKQGLRYVYQFSPDGLLTRFAADSAAGRPEIRYEAQVEYADRSSHPRDLPVRVEFKRYNAKVLVVHEIWEIEVVQLGKPLDRSLLSWKALNPKVGAPLVVDHDYERLNRSWNGSGFGPYAPKVEPDAPGGAAAISVATSDSFWLFATISAALGGLLAYRLVRRRAQPAA